MSTFWQLLKHFLAQKNMLISNLIFMGVALLLILLFYLPHQRYSESRIANTELTPFQWKMAELALLLERDAPQLDLKNLQQHLHRPDFQATLQKNWRHQIPLTELFDRLHFGQRDNQLILRVYSRHQQAPVLFLQRLIQQVKADDQAQQKTIYAQLLKEVQAKLLHMPVSQEAPAPDPRAPSLYEHGMQQALFDILGRYSQIQSELEIRKLQRMRLKISPSQLNQAARQFISQSSLPARLKQLSFYQTNPFKSYQQQTEYLNFQLTHHPQLAPPEPLPAPVGKMYFQVLGHHIMQQLLEQQREFLAPANPSQAGLKTIYDYYFARYYFDWLKQSQIELVSQPLQFAPSLKILQEPTPVRQDTRSLLWFSLLPLGPWAFFMAWRFRAFSHHPPAPFILDYLHQLLARFYFAGVLPWRKRLFNNQASFVYPEESQRYQDLIKHLEEYYAHRLPKVWLISSLLEDEGKSISALEIAGSFASLGKKTILLDLNLQHPKQHHYLKLMNTKGLRNILDKEIPFHEGIQPEAYHHVDIVTSGQSLLNPGWLHPNHFSDFIDYLKTEYDAILIDTSALKHSLEPLLLLKKADGLLVVINPAKHTLESLQLLKYYMYLLREKCLGYVIRN